MRILAYDVEQFYMMLRQSSVSPGSSLWTEEMKSGLLGFFEFQIHSTHLQNLKVHAHILCAFVVLILLSSFQLITESGTFLFTIRNGYSTSP